MPCKTRRTGNPIPTKLITVIALIVIGVFVASQTLTLSPTKIGTSPWGIAAGLDALSVNTVSGTGTQYAIDVDPDGPVEMVLGRAGPLTYADVVGDAPTVHCGLGSSVRAVDEPPRVVGTNIAYLYAIDLDFKTLAQQVANTYFYEAEEAACTVDFTVALAYGDSANVTGAMITDVWIDDYASGLTEFPGASWQEAQSLFSEGLDPSKNIEARVVTSTQGGEGVIVSGSGTTTAQCRVSVSLRAGGVYEWGYIIYPVLPKAESVHIYNVYAVYKLYIEVLIPIGDAPPLTNPFDVLIAILQDFGFRIRDGWDQLLDLLGVIGLIIVGIIVLVLIAFILHIRKKR